MKKREVKFLKGSDKEEEEGEREEEMKVLSWILEVVRYRLFRCCEGRDVVSN